MSIRKLHILASPTFLTRDAAAANAERTAARCVYLALSSLTLFAVLQTD